MRHIVCLTAVLLSLVIGTGAHAFDKTTRYENTGTNQLSFTHTFDSRSTNFDIEVLGAGGPGEGANSGSGARASCGSPGGSGAYGRVEGLPVPASRSGSVVVAPKVNGAVPVTGVNAPDGGTSSYTDSTNGAVNSTGGSGGQQETSEATNYATMNSNGRAGIATHTPVGGSAKIVGAGQRGGVCQIIRINGSAIMAFADGGPSSPYGRGFEGRRITGTGKVQGADAEGFGAGGGGSVSIDSGSVRGGNSGAGLVIIHEYGP